jgi:hypothetical protein
MARSFKMKAGFRSVQLGGAVLTDPRKILTGDQWAMFCPNMLEEILPEAPERMITEDVPNTTPAVPEENMILDEQIQSVVEDVPKEILHEIEVETPAKLVEEPVVEKTEVEDVDTKEDTPVRKRGRGIRVKKDEKPEEMQSSAPEQE